MNKRLSISDISRGTRSVRVLSYVLLFLFAYGTTTEVVHSHRTIPRGIPAAESGFLQDSGGTSSTRQTAQSGDCLVCQFQQNLSSAELFIPSLVFAAATTSSPLRTQLTSFLSQARSPGQGRAPPAIS
ncbi:MAG: hypothetical protein M3R68_01720 [Acidobacteriota bacterium]|nr:hypothetical protein [Acidobacteriota bacterium]